MSTQYTLGQSVRINQSMLRKKREKDYQFTAMQQSRLITEYQKEDALRGIVTSVDKNKLEIEWSDGSTMQCFSDYIESL